MPRFINEGKMGFLRIMKEDLYSSMTVMALRKGSPLKEVINVVLRSAREAGLFYYWEDLTVRTYLSSLLQVSVAQSRIQIDDGPIKLQLHHIEVSVA